MKKVSRWPESWYHDGLLKPTRVAPLLPADSMTISRLSMDQAYKWCPAIISDVPITACRKVAFLLQKNHPIGVIVYAQIGPCRDNRSCSPQIDAMLFSIHG